MAWRRIDVHRATERGDVAVLKRYLDSGGDAEKKDKEYGAAPVHWAALRGRLEALSLLLERGGNLESRTGTDGTPLVWGCMGGNAPVVRYLLERGANISAITKGKGTALHHATHSGYPEVVSLLLEKGANPKAQDNRGERPGDKFDPEVSEGNRRAIAKALAKAAKSRGSSKRASVSRSKRHPIDDSREAHPSASSHARSNGNGNGDGSVGINGHPQTEDEELSAAAAAVAAAAWTPKSPSKRPRPIAVPEEQQSTRVVDASGGGVFASVDRNRSASQHSGADADDRPSRRATITAVAADENGGRRPPSSPRFNGCGKDDDRGPAAASPEFTSPEISGLRRRVKDATLAAATAEDRDSESRAAVRRALAEADERARAAGAAERARSEVLVALVQALEQRLRDKDEQVDKLTAQLEDSASRLRQREQEVMELRKRVEGLPLTNDVAGATTAATQAAAPPQPAITTTPSHVNRALTLGEDESSESSPFAREEQLAENTGGGAPDGRSCLRTRSSPTLSPTSDAAAAAAASARLPHAGGAQEAGTDWPGASYDPGGGGGGDVTPPGGGRDGNRRSTIGPGTISADESFGYALESLAARDGGAGGQLQAGVLGWWRRGEWREAGGAGGAVKSQPLRPPAPAVVEDQERLGSLYSMIARR
eukprot:g1324.t1